MRISLTRHARASIAFLFQVACQGCDASEINFSDLVLNEIKHTRSQKHAHPQITGGFALKADMQNLEYSKSEATLKLIRRLSELAPTNILPMALQGLESNSEYVRYVASVVLFRVITETRGDSIDIPTFYPLQPVGCESNFPAVSFYTKASKEILDQLVRSQ